MAIFQGFRHSSGSNVCGRPSNGTPAGAKSANTDTPRQQPKELPEYERPQYPLNQKAQRALAHLLRDHNLAPLELHLKDSNAALTNYAADLNEKLAKKEALVRRQQKRKRKILNKSQPSASQASNANDDEDESVDDRLQQLEDDLKTYEEKVKKMTEAMDTQIVRNIDGLQTVNDIKEVLSHVSVQTENAAFRYTQQAREAERSQGQRQNNGGDEGMADSTLGFQVTNDGASSRTQDPGPGPTEIFTQKLQQKEMEYQRLSRATRYASHNEYAGFRKAVHEARYSYIEDAPALPHPKRWFPEKGSPAPGTATLSDSDDSDDDIQIAREKVSTKCPLTLQELKDPLSSRKCPHAFERAAILEFINNPTLAGRRGGPKMQPCPVSGCNVNLTVSDLYEDVALIRKIKRIQDAKRREQDEEEDEDDDSLLNSTPRRPRDGTAALPIHSSPHARGQNMHTPRNNIQTLLGNGSGSGTQPRSQQPRGSAATTISSFDDEGSAGDVDMEDE